jgi:micrococcal nuclease
MNSSLGDILAKAELSEVYLWMKISWLVGLVLVGTTACQSPPAARTLVQVDRAISGSTVELASKQRLRLIGLDAPRWEQKPWGNDAKERLNAIIQQQNHQFWLELEPGNSQSSDGRQYGYLWQKDLLVNEQLIKEGHALAVTKYVQPKYEQQLARAQAYARITGVGIWSHESPLRIRPSDFKAKN